MAAAPMHNYCPQTPVLSELSAEVISANHCGGSQ